MARSAMEELSNSESAVRERKRREVKRRREMYLERLFSYEPPPEDDRTIYIRLAREECDLVEQIRVAHEAGIWRSIPDSVYETLLEGRFFWPKKPVVKDGAQFVPDKGIVLMALKLMHLYFIGSTKYHGMILRDMYQVNGKEMKKRAVFERVNRGALYTQVEELGAKVEDLDDDDFDFGDFDDWDL
jgi:hypothetical protein